MQTPNLERVLVWDVPLRVFHWLLAGSFAGAFATGDSERWRDVHAILGYTVVALVIFRIAWGVVGTRYARFASMPVSPRSALAYLRSLPSGRPAHHVGHNPAGSLAIYALLAIAAVTAISGVAALAGGDAEWTGEIHEALANAMLALVVLHIAGVVVGSLAHRENLAAAMVTGRKRAAPHAGIRQPRRLVAAALIGAVAALWTGAVPLPGVDLQRLALIGVSTSAHAGGHHSDDDD